MVPLDAIDLAVLELVCIGYRDQDIASALNYSVQSVKNRVSGMLRRSRLENRLQLALSFTNQRLVAGMMRGFDQVQHQAPRH